MKSKQDVSLYVRHGGGFESTEYLCRPTHREFSRLICYTRRIGFRVVIAQQKIKGGVIKCQ